MRLSGLSKIYGNTAIVVDYVICIWSTLPEAAGALRSTGHDINASAPLALAQLAIPVMRRQGRGTIVNLGSVAVRVALPWWVCYSASKFAVHSINGSIRSELRRGGIHVMKACSASSQTNLRQNVLTGVVPPEVLAIQKVVTPSAGRRPRVGRIGAML